MTPRETRLRNRIDVLTGQRDDALDLLAVQAKRRAVRLPLACVYCGGQRVPGLAACAGHRDLLALDPFFAMAETRAA